MDSRYITSYFERVKQVRGTSEEILEPFKESLLNEFGRKQEAEVLAWAINQAYLAMGNLLTICAVERVDACPMEGFVPAEYDRILKLDEKGLQSVLVLPVGYRSGEDVFSSFKKVRRQMSDTIISIEAPSH